MTITCPNCKHTAQSKRTIPSGTRIKCHKCACTWECRVPQPEPGVPVPNPRRRNPLTIVALAESFIDLSFLSSSSSSAAGARAYSAKLHSEGIRCQNAVPPAVMPTEQTPMGRISTSLLRKTSSVPSVHLTKRRHSGMAQTRMMAALTTVTTISTSISARMAT